MRLTADGLTDDERGELSAFSEGVPAVRDGPVPAEKRVGDPEATWVTIPDLFLTRTDGDRVDSFIYSIYNSFLAFHDTFEYLAARAIICPTNVVVDAIDDWISGPVGSEGREYLNVDRVAPGSEQVPNVDVIYTEGILNAIAQPNYHKHRLVPNLLLLW